MGETLDTPTIILFGERGGRRKIKKKMELIKAGRYIREGWEILFGSEIPPIMDFLYSPIGVLIMLDLMLVCTMVLYYLSKIR